MNQRRYHMAVVLMLLAIAAVLGFQLYWLRSTFKEENRLLQIRTNVLFREAVNTVQIEKLNLDTNVRIRFSGPSGPVNSINVIRNIDNKDTDPVLPNKGAAVMITLNEKRSFSGTINKDLPNPDSLKKMKIVEGYPMPLLQVLEGIDAAQDTLKVKDVSDRLSHLFAREKIDLGFSIQRKLLDSVDVVYNDTIDLSTGNEITVGFVKPMKFILQLEDPTAFVVKRMSLPILFSFLLVALTLTSFLLLLRNLIQQRRLTLLKNDFISNITHELKTPIATVSVAIEAMRSFNALQDPERTKTYLDISAQELQRLSLLVDKVLKLSMFEKQQIELQQEEVDLKVLLEEVVASLRLQIEKYGAKLTIEATGDDHHLRADRLHLTSVIFNLLDNALKYSKGDPVVRVEVNSTPQQIELAVTDNGIGISEEYRKKVFDKFFRVPSGNTHNVKGYGLGLSYVAYVVARHAGTIEVESQPGIGSRFIIRLPRS